MKATASIFIFLILITFASCNEQEPFNAVKQFNADVTEIDAFLQANSINAIHDQSGVRVVINKLGIAGLPPRRDHQIKIKYSGRLFKTGQVFESNITAEGLLNNYIEGWKEGIEILPEGTIATLYIPSGLAYGNRTYGPIPPNSILVYEIELQDVTLSSAEQQQLTADAQLIDTYLTNNGITATSTPFGVRYVIKQKGPGITPGWYHKIRVNYTGKVLATGNVFFTGTIEPTETFDSRVVDFLPGLQVAFQSLPIGSKATVYIPSTLGFGNTSTGNGAVPANANLIYEIETFSIVN